MAGRRDAEHLCLAGDEVPEEGELHQAPEQSLTENAFQRLQNLLRYEYRSGDAEGHRSK